MNTKYIDCSYIYKMTVVDIVRVAVDDHIESALEPDAKDIWTRVCLDFISGSDDHPDRGGFVEQYVINDTQAKCLDGPRYGPEKDLLVGTGSWKPGVLIQAVQKALGSDNMECEFEIVRRKYL